jgi:hypothetical protein
VRLRADDPFAKARIAKKSLQLSGDLLLDLFYYRMTPVS